MVCAYPLLSTFRTTNHDRKNSQMRQKRLKVRFSGEPRIQKRLSLVVNHEPNDSQLDRPGQV